jgi:hypothetical protein
MDQVDTFVLLDNVQFEKQSWQQRNRIKTPTGLQWLTVPVVFRGRLEQKIQAVEIRDLQFWRKHLRGIELNYRRTPFFENYFSALSSNLETLEASTSLSDLNMRLIKWLTGILGIKTPLIRASLLGEAGKRTQLLANICRNLGANYYVSPIGSAGYLLPELSILSACHVETVFQNYSHPQYKQSFPPFVPYASVIDLLFNEGPRSMEIIRSGRNTPLIPTEVAAIATAARPEESAQA